MFDAVMQSGFSLFCALVPLFYTGRGCLADVITKLLLECSLLCGDLCVFYALRSSVTCFTKLSISVICSVLSSVLRRSVLLLLAQQGWVTPVMALQSDPGSVRGRGALHILQRCQQAARGMAAGKERAGTWQLFCLRSLLLSKPAHCTCEK